MSDTSEKLQSLQSNSESQLQSDSQTQKQNVLWHFFGSLNPIRVIAGLSISFTGIGFAFGYSKIARLRVQKSDIRNQKMKSEEILSPVSRNPIRTALKALRFF